MKKLVITGGKKIVGTIDIAGAKNAALPLMVASILTDEKLTLTNVPHVADISTMANLLASLGIEFSLDGFDPDGGNFGRAVILNAKEISKPVAEYDLVRKMRASILILGPLLARFGHAKVSLPGGCAIGARPVDLHLTALEKMGAIIKVVGGYVEAEVQGKLKGAEIEFEKTSVGATENILMAATLAEGKTILHNAAREPEIVDLALCLRKMGAKIEGEGTSDITIIGVNKLHAAKHHIIADRIEAGTYAVAAVITDGCVKITGLNIDLFSSIRKELEQSGAEFRAISDNEVEIKRSKKEITSVDISTEPYPGFPTDMQAQFMSLMTIGNGTSIIRENIFENRFMHVMELLRMGADIKYSGNVATVKGVKELFGAEVMATDLRASVCMVLAGLIANGQTTINRLYHLERGYERLAEKLIQCGADIKVLY